MTDTGIRTLMADRIRAELTRQAPRTSPFDGRPYLTVDHDGHTTHVNGGIDVDALALAVIDAAENEGIGRF